MKYDFNYNE
ncbi:hypothetical protein EC960109_1751A, partial [Escherichia coli 96.0109]